MINSNIMLILRKDKTLLIKYLNLYTTILNIWYTIFIYLKV